MGNILIRHIPEKTISLAKKIAAKNHRSLQDELSELLIQAVQFHAGPWSQRADKIYKRLASKGKHYSDSVKLLRQDRNR